MHPARLQILVLLALLHVRHVLADFVLQSRFLLDNRVRYGHPGGLLHIAAHTARPPLLLLAAGVAAAGLPLLPAVEAVGRYHIDGTKDNLVARARIPVNTPRYRHLTSLDQGLHQLTKLAIAAWALSLPG